MAQPLICFILHGRRCPGSLPDRLLESFAEFQVEIHITSSSLGAEEVACLAVEQGCDYLIAVGGDGTVHEMVNGVMRATSSARGKVVLGVLTYGTGNDFARSLGVTHSIEALRALIVAGTTRRLDLGSLSCTGLDRAPRRIYFTNIASLGISSAVVARVKSLPRWLPAPLAFSWATTLSLLSWRPRRMTLRLDGGAAQSEALIELCVANGRFFGGGLGIAPEARLDDGLLNVVMIRTASVSVFLRFMRALRQARKIDNPRIEYRVCRRVEIDTPPGDGLLEVDGELVGHASAQIELVPGALRWLVGVAKH